MLLVVQQRRLVQLHNLNLLLLCALQLGRQSPEVFPPAPQAVAAMLDAVETILPAGLVLGTVAQRPMLTAAPAANAVATIVAQTRKRQARAPKQLATFHGFCCGGVLHLEAAQSSSVND
jgi:hypothetical protein